MLWLSRPTLTRYDPVPPATGRRGSEPRRVVNPSGAPTRQAIIGNMTLSMTPTGVTALARWQNERGDSVP